MAAFLRYLLGALALTCSLRASTIETVHATMRTLGQTGVHQFELEFRTAPTELDLLAPAIVDLSTIEVPLPPLSSHRHWLTANDEGLRHLQLRIEGASPWTDALCVPAPDTLQGTVVPEPAALALVFAIAAFGWGTVQRRRPRFAAVPV